MVRSGSILGLIVGVLLVTYGLPTFAQTRIATLIPGAPLSSIAASRIIYSSGLPAELLADGNANEVTRSRDYVNAYRLAHTQISKNGWYRGLSEAHGPLLEVMVEAIGREGFGSTMVTYEARKNDILYKFWTASNNQNAIDLGYPTYTELREAVIALRYVKLDMEANSLLASYDAKWK